MLDAMLARPKGDLLADLAYEQPALTILTLLGVEAEKVADVKRRARSRILLTWGNLSDEEQDTARGQATARTQPGGQALRVGLFAA
jgi:cytochrome P450